MCPVGASQPLDRPVRAPARFEEKVNTLLLVLGLQARMVGAPGAASVRKYQDALGASHERRSLGL